MGTAPVEDMQALSITSLSASEVEQQYELIGPLGKGTYGRVDLVAHRTQGECESVLNVILLVLMNDFSYKDARVPVLGPLIRIA